MISLLPGCGLRRSEVVGPKVEAIQRREDHWAIVDSVGIASTCIAYCVNLIWTQ